MIIFLNGRSSDLTHLNNAEVKQLIDNKKLSFDTFIRIFTESGTDREIDIDTCGDVVDDIYPICLCLDSSCEFTEDFYNDFKDILSCNCVPDISSCWLTVECGTEEKQRKLYRLLAILAGYASKSVYSKYVIEDDEDEDE